MIKLVPLFACLLLLSHFSPAQRLLERAGKVTFFSDAPLEDIRAVNSQVLAILDPASGEVAVSMLMKGFQFKKALMQEHFNENYVESDKYPKATFTGTIRDYSDNSLTIKTAVGVTGEITLHGVTQPVDVMITLTPSENGSVEVDGVFTLAVADFNIDIPSLVVDNIAEVVEVTLEFTLKPENSP